MNTESNNNSLLEMPPEQQGIFYELIKQQAPQWLLTADTAVRDALYAALVASFRTRSEVMNVLKGLKSPESFCMPRLTKALSDKLGMPIDVPSVIFQHIRSTSSLLGLRQKLIMPINRDLLTAACENFDASETLASDYSPKSLLYIPEKLTGRGNKTLSLQPHEFAMLCRTLDLGKNYQEHIKTLFSADSTAGEFQAKCIAYEKDNFAVETHIAYMKGHITADVYQMLKTVIAGQQSIKLGKNTLGFQKVKADEVLFHGVMFLGPVSVHDDNDYRCVMYVPADPLHPLRQYSSFRDFETELGTRLEDEPFKNFFLRFIALEDRAGFLKKIAGLASQSIFNSSTSGPLSGGDFTGDMFQELFRQRCAHVIADARLLVVPTADKDETARQARLETYKAVGLNALAMLLSFVPVLNGVILAVSAAQLLMEVYDGIEAWTKGEQEQALDYLFDTIENLVLSAAISAGGAAAGKALRTVRTSSFVQRLRKVQVPSRGTRLWKPDLSVYRQERILPTSLRADERGLILDKNKQYLPIGSHLYVVEHLPSLDQWQIQHPVSAERYLPVLETNNVGAWRHDSELPTEWDRVTLLRRLGVSSTDVSDAQVESVIAVSGLGENTLRQLYIDDRQPAALLVDVVRRFKAEKLVSEFVEQMNTPSAMQLADADLQLYLLASLSLWPQDTQISITGITGREVATYGMAEASTKIVLTQTQLRKGEFYSPLIAALDAKQRQRLLVSTSNDPLVQAEALGAQIGKQAMESRRTLFTRLYQRATTSPEAATVPLLSRFADMPVTVAQELVRNADMNEWRELENARIPLRLSEEGRRYLRLLRVNRAYEGLYLDVTGGTDTDWLVLDTLSHLPGWPKEHFVQIMDWVGDGHKTTRIGPRQAAGKTLIDVFPNYLKAIDGNDGILADHPQNTRALYFQTLWEGLPLTCRKALGVEEADAGVALRQKITTLALERRKAFARLLFPEAIEVDDGASSGTQGQAAGVNVPSPTGAGVDASNDPSLVHRAKELYPMHMLIDIDRFLLTLGAGDVLRTRKLEALRLEFQTLRNDLSRWVNSKTRYQSGSGPRATVPRHSKLRAALAIQRAWRKETPTQFTDLGLSYTLVLPAEPLGAIPVIRADFSHVTQLEISKVGFSAGLTAFLHNFRNLRSLDLSGNELTSLPLAIEDMSGLRQLDLSENQIRLTPESVQRLAGMTTLEALNLSFNPALNQVPDISKMLRLEHLALRGAGISGWPSGMWELTRLRTLDMRDNRIEAIPQALFDAPVALNRGINLDGNPLLPASLRRIAEYQFAYKVTLGIMTAGYAEVKATLTSLATQRSVWLRGLPIAQAEARQVLWDSLAENPSSRDFFQVLRQLHASADFPMAFSDLSERVWNIVEAASENEALRRSLFRLAQLGRISGDAYLLLFSALEIRVLSYRAMLAARVGGATLEGELIRLLRGLFRLQQLEHQAQMDITSRSRTGTLTQQQGRELSLAYRVDLAERLALPSQPRRLNHRLSIEVSDEQLEKAYREVVKAEHTLALEESVRDQEFWNEYLRQTYHERFVAIDERYALSMGLIDSTDLSRAAAAQRMSTLFENFRNERRDLYKQLTEDALARNPGLALVADVVAADKPSDSST